MKRVVTTHSLYKIAICVELDQPQRSSCRVRHQQIAIRVEGKSIGDEILRVVGELSGFELRLYG